MLRVWKWIGIEVLFFLFTFGVALPILISAQDTFLVSVGFAYLVFALPYVGLWYIPMKAYHAYLAASGETLDEKVEQTYAPPMFGDDGHADISNYPRRLQPRATGERRNSSKQPRE